MTTTQIPRQPTTRGNGARSQIRDERRRPYRLTDAELEVLFLMLQGEYPREIAGYLGLPLAEVESRQLSIRAKMGARSATEAAVMAIKQQIFPNTKPPLRAVP